MNNLPMPGMLETCEHTEHYVLEESGHALHVLSLRGSAGSQRLALDDLEFQIEEAVTADELAHGIFVLTGGVLGLEGSCGESARFYFHYSPSWPGKIGLQCKAQTTGCACYDVPLPRWLQNSACPAPGQPAQANA
jgi:hypothetical protein